MNSILHTLLYPSAFHAAPPSRLIFLPWAALALVVLAATATAASFELLDPPEFSHTGGFYDEPLLLTLSAAEGETIYYTLDGSEPDPANVGGATYAYKNTYPLNPGDPFGDFLERRVETFRYEQELEIGDRSIEPNTISGINTQFSREPLLPAGNLFKATAVRARSFRGEAAASPTVTHTFFVHPEAKNRYNIAVVSITTDESNLFDYGSGIYVPGKIADEWRQDNPSSQFHEGRPSNSTQRGREWEHPAHLEFFEPGGERTFAQGMGIRIHGGWSRSYPRKSLRLYARSAYDQTNTFTYPFFAGLTATGIEGLPVESFRRLILRNSGNDYGETLIRDAMIQELVRPLPIDTQAYRPVIHFINGEYWGIINLRERFDQHYLASHYRLAPDDVVILSNNAELDTGVEDDRQHYLDLLAFATGNDLADKGAFSQLSTMMDVENFAMYYAIQVYIGNTDWPQNNVDFWRKRTPGYSPEAPHGHDGRWRWMIYDTDFGFERNEVDENSIARLMHMGKEPGYEWSTLLFLEILENPEFRTLFINTVADLKNTVFEPERVISIIDTINAEIEPYRDEHGERWGSGTDRGETLKEFARLRPGHVREHLLETFNLPGSAEVTIGNANPEGGRLRLNSLSLGAEASAMREEEQESWTGTYFQGAPITVTAIPEAGYRFTGWTGSNETSASLTLPLSGDVTLVAHFELDEEALKAFAPSPYPLSTGPYIFSYWDPKATPESYPPHMVFEQTSIKDPPAEAQMDSLWTLSYDRNNRSRINGLGNRGISFINTGNAQEEDDSGFLGSAVLALDTRGQEEIRVTWTAGTRIPNDRVYGLRLQYRVGHFGPFRDLLDEESQPVEYVRNESADHNEVIGPFRIPAEVEDRPYVQLRWKYYYIAGESGPRAQLRLDNIVVTAGPLDPAAAPTYEIWKKQAFPDPATRNNPDVAGPKGDPRGNGIPNLLRYAFGIALAEPPGDRLPQTRFTDGRLSLRFFRDPLKTDIAYLVEASSNFINWSEVLYDSTIDTYENTDGDFMTVFDSVPADASRPYRFLRLRIELLE